MFLKENFVNSAKYKTAALVISAGLTMASVGSASAGENRDSSFDNSPKSGLEWGNPNDNSRGEFANTVPPDNQTSNDENATSPVVENPTLGILPIIPNILPKTEIKANIPGYSLQFPNLPGVTGHFFPEKEGFTKGFAVLNDKTSQTWTEYNNTGGYQKWGKAISTLWRGADGKLRQAFEKGILEAEVNPNGQIIKSGTMNLPLEIAKKKLDLEKSIPNPDIYGPNANKLSILSLLPKIPTPKSPDVSGLSENVKQAIDLNIIPITAKVAVEAAALTPQEVLSQSPENMAQYWPLQVGNYWEFEGVNKDGIVFHSKIEVEAEVNFCGEEVFSLLFTKDKLEGYWAPGEQKNLRWYVKKGFKSFGNRQYKFAKGDKRTQRTSDKLGEDSNIELRQTRYDRPEEDAPAYMLYPDVVDGKSFNAYQNYYASCDTSTMPWKANWNVSYNKLNNTTMRIRYSEIDDSLPIPNPWAVEDWDFQAGVGPVRIAVLAPSNKILTMTITKSNVQNSFLDGLLKNDTAGKYIYGNKDYKKVSPKEVVITEISKESVIAYKDNEFDKANESNKFGKYKFAPENKMAKTSPLSRKNA